MAILDTVTAVLTRPIQSFTAENFRELDDYTCEIQTRPHAARDGIYPAREEEIWRRTGLVRERRLFQRLVRQAMRVIEVAEYFYPPLDEEYSPGLNGRSFFYSPSRGFVPCMRRVLKPGRKNPQLLPGSLP